MFLCVFSPKKLNTSEWAYHCVFDCSKLRCKRGITLLLSAVCSRYSRSLQHYNCHNKAELFEKIMLKPININIYGNAHKIYKTYMCNGVKF